jgi:hypothetical protein
MGSSELSSRGKESLQQEFSSTSPSSSSDMLDALDDPLRLHLSTTQHPKLLHGNINVDVSSSQWQAFSPPHKTVTSSHLGGSVLEFASDVSRGIRSSKSFDEFVHSLDEWVVMKPLSGSASDPPCKRSVPLGDDDAVGGALTTHRAMIEPAHGFAPRSNSVAEGPWWQRPLQLLSELASCSCGEGAINHEKIPVSTTTSPSQLAEALIPDSQALSISNVAWL